LQHSSTEQVRLDLVVVPDKVAQSGHGIGAEITRCPAYLNYQEMARFVWAGRRKRFHAMSHSLLLRHTIARYVGRTMKKDILLIVVTLSAVTCYAQSQGAKTVVLEKNEGEARLRRPLGVLPIPSAEFILKVTPGERGSNTLCLAREDIPPEG